MTSPLRSEPLRFEESPVAAKAALLLLEARAKESGSELAACVDAGEDVLHFLALNGAEATRSAVAANPAAAPKTNLALADDREESVRASLADKIGRLLPGLLTSESEHLRELTLATLNTLSRDKATAVRAALSEAIKHLDSVPKPVVQRLARDVETIVALPVLEFSPLLDDQDILEILAAARATDVFCAVARRKGLSPDASDAVVATLDTRAVATLIGNESAKLRKATLDKIVVRAAEVAELQQPLVLRADLSAGLIRKLASFVGAALIEVLAGRDGLDDETRAKLKSELKARIEQTGKGGTAPDGEKASKTQLPKKFDEAFVEAAADAGQRDSIVAALSKMGRIDVEVVRKVLGSGSAKALTALAWRAGLGMRTAFKIQCAIMHLRGGDLLYARGGSAFPLSEDDMRWQLKYIGVVD
jgi:uncharacterized protein (DUF2336 family)